VAGALTSQEISESFVERLTPFKQWFDPIAIYLVVFQIVRRPRVWKTAVIIMMITLVAVALLALDEYQDRKDSAHWEKIRVQGVMGQSNSMAAFFVYYMFLFGGFGLERMGGRRWPWLLAFLLCFRGIMVTFSRGAYLGCALGIVGLAWCKRRKLGIAALVFFAVASVLPMLIPAGVRYRFNMTYGKEQTMPLDGEDVESGLDKSAATRLLIWRGGLAMIRDSPILGVGFGRFSSEIRNYADVDRNWDAHNTYLITAAEMGVPALVLFLAVLGMAFLTARRAYRRHPDRFMRATALGVLGGLSGLSLTNMFGSRLDATQVSGYLYILFALMARADIWARSESSGGGVVGGEPAPPPLPGLMHPIALTSRRSDRSPL
jgi:O-antigen ligase